MTVYQHIVEFNSNDGIGNDILGISNILNISQINNKIITLKNKSPIINEHIIELYNKNLYYTNKDIHILHYGSSGYPIRYFLEQPGKKILRFHNITPIDYFKNFCENDFFSNLDDSYKLSILELKSLLINISEVWYDSEFNKKTLHDYFLIKKSTLIEKVFPIFRKYPKIIRTNYSPNYNLLFTGRIVPHKKIEDLLIILFFLRQISENYSLILVGKIANEFSKYYQYLKSIIKELKLENCIQWKIDISENELVDIRNTCGFYISMSEHEGFGIPLLEAFTQGLIVIAFATTAVGETLREGGVKIFQKNFPFIAEMVHYINFNSKLKQKICDQQYKVLDYYEKNIELSNIL